MSEVPACELCGCIGNESCGHEPLDKERLCALDALLICPCCRIDKNHMKPEPDPNQQELF